MDVLDLVRSLAEDLANMVIEDVLEFALEIGRYQCLVNGRWETQYFDIWIGSVTINGETKAWGIRTDGYIWVGDDLFSIDYFHVGDKLKELFEGLEETLSEW